MNARSFEIKETVLKEASFYQDNMRMSAESGYPLAIYNPNFFLIEDSPEQMGLAYLNANKALLGLRNSDIENLKLHAIRHSPSGTTVRFRQHHLGLAVNKAELTISINKQNVVSFLANSFVYGVEIDNVAPSLSLDDAREIMLEKLPIAGEYTETEHELMIYHLAGESRLIYRIILFANDPVGEWEAYINAHDGSLIKLEDIAFYYREHHEATLPGIPPLKPVFQMMMMTDGTGNVFDPDPLSSANAEYGDTGFTDNSDNTSTQLDAEMVSRTLLDISFDGTDYSLAGPWAEVMDFEPPFRGLFEQSTNDWDFNRFDNAFEAVNTYYHVDASMRYLNNDLGLNISPDEYPGGVQFDPHGLGGADNSHYVRSTQRMAFGEGGVDDAEDSDVIHHELGHGLHDWVTNGSLSQVEGLSEGSGDYWAASYNRHLGDWSPGDEAYNWVFIWDGHNPFWNGRVVNFVGTYPNDLSGGIHNQGQIWSTCMMNVWDELGREQTDKAFWEGLGDTNGSSNQNDAANAVFQAATDMNYSNAELAAMHEQMTNTGYTLPEIPLDIELYSFSALRVDNHIAVSWITSSETDNDFFTLEKSADGLRFEEIAVVDAIGNSSELQRYTHLDKKPFGGINYYRLKQTDTDRTSSYSKIISVDFKEEEKLKIFPNPVSETLFIQTGHSAFINARISIYDTMGRPLNSFSTNQVNDKTILVETSALAAGFYSLKIESQGQQFVERFYKQ